MFRKLWRIKVQLMASKGWQQVKLGVSYPTLCSPSHFLLLLLELNFYLPVVFIACFRN